jgi:hypothetical protein
MRYLHRRRFSVVGQLYVGANDLCHFNLTKLKRKKTGLG